MSAIYDNWERLVDAVLKKQELWELFHARSPSLLSEASSSDLSSSISDLSSRIHDYSLDFSSAGSSSRLVPKLVLVSEFSPAFGVEDVFLASADLLGRGTFGSVYTALMENGVKIAVRRLNSASVSEQDFKRCMTFVRHFRHENVVPLRAYYSSKDERLMLYDYYSKGSVFDLLHGQTGENRSRVDWETRMKIAIGAARGIAEIHYYFGGMLVPVVHGNIKSSNIFLNSQDYGCVSDFGMTSMIQTTFTPTARCYAHEVKNNTRNVSEASDVYSFGIVLLELLTRKSSTNVPGGPKAVDLVKLVSSVKSKERAAKVFDIADLLNHPLISEKMVKVFQIAMRCIEKSIKKRPRMFEVVEMLEDIGTFTQTSLASQGKKLVFLDDDINTFEYEDMLRADAEELGKGVFGTSIKAVLKNGNTIVVKRLKDVVATLKEFQHHMAIIGRMRHAKLAQTKAYYFSNGETLLVCDFYNQGSLSTLLHDKSGTVRTTLDWESRLKIAIGAARGIAHIHRQDGGKFVHGNIKSSNIFLNGQNYGIVSDFGMAKLTIPIRFSWTTSAGYTAPEVTDTKKVSQASDVYSFGVVLLELVSGRPAQPLHTTDDGEVVPLVKWIRSVLRNEWTSEVFDVEMRYRDAADDDGDEALVRLLQIGIDCAQYVPERRPRMSEVVKMLEEIGGPNEQRSEDRWEKPSIESRLEHLLEDLLPSLRP